MLSWLYDIKIDNQGIRFVLFSFWTVYFLRFENVESVKEISCFSLGSFTAYNFKNRLCERTFLIELKHGWFTRKILVTPETPNEFLSRLKENKVYTEKLPSP